MDEHIDVTYGVDLRFRSNIGDGAIADPGRFLTPWPLDAGSGAGACILESQMIVVTDTLEGAKRFWRMPQLALALDASFDPLQVRRARETLAGLP